MKRLITAMTAAFALAGATACTQNAARDVDQPVSARQDSTGARDTTSPAYKAMQRSDSTTMTRTDTTARQDSSARMVTPPPAVKDTAGTQPATTSPR
jgi:hypothetical protein